MRKPCDPSRCGDRDSSGLWWQRTFSYPYRRHTEERSMTQPIRYFRLTWLLLAALGIADAGPRYHVIDLGTLGGTRSYGWAINATGQVTGEAWTAGNAGIHAFFYSDGVMTDLGTLGGTHSLGFAINAA